MHYYYHLLKCLLVVSNLFLQIFRYKTDLYIIIFRILSLVSPSLIFFLTSTSFGAVFAILARNLKCKFRIQNTYKNQPCFKSWEPPQRHLDSVYFSLVLFSDHSSADCLQKIRWRDSFGSLYVLPILILLQWRY